MAAARHPRLYADWGVPDTLDGRFDMITLHTYLVLERLKGEEPEFRQAVVDEFFRDMDRSLREMGVGDLSVGKKVRKMAESFYGRIAAYDAALAAPGDGLAAALARNVFPDEEGGPDIAGVRRLAEFVLTQRARLAAQPVRAIAGGDVRFEEPGP